MIQPLAGVVIAAVKQHIPILHFQFLPVFSIRPVWRQIISFVRIPYSPKM